MLAKFNAGNKLKDFSGMLGGRKGNSYVIPVSSDKTVLEMAFVESTSFIWLLYLELRLKPLTKWNCRLLSHDLKNV